LLLPENGYAEFLKTTAFGIQQQETAFSTDQRDHLLSGYVIQS